MDSDLNQVDCPRCGEPVMQTAPACPNCGRTQFVEHPGDIEPIKHPPTDLPPADSSSYGPEATKRTG